MALRDSRVFKDRPKVWGRSTDLAGAVDHFCLYLAVDRQRLISVQFFSLLVAFRS
jgi:hypothetical protein